MNDEQQLRDEFREIVRDVSESLSYLRELGVESLEGELKFSAPEAPFQEAHEPRAAAVKSAPALERNARAESSPPPARPHVETPASVPRANRFASIPRVGALTTSAAKDKTEMPKKRTPDPVPPEPRETLFGEIKPKDELSLGRPGETMEDIRKDIGECVRCPLYQGRTKIVHTEGHAQARLMFVGEAPGADEDASGRPFVGRAGQLLNKIIEAIGLRREEVLIGNVNRCRPPGNRQPTTEEAKTCKPFLLRDIAAVRPEVIVVLGNTAMKNLLDTKEGITKLRGHFQDYNGIKVMPTFHPAYLLRDPTKKRETWDDMKKVRDYLNQK
jgi:DNA polymerase